MSEKREPTGEDREMDGHPSEELVKPVHRFRRTIDCDNPPIALAVDAGRSSSRGRGVRQDGSQRG
jgi:hypothetical protein